jgi:S1-C subfamily serine protease
MSRLLNPFGWALAIFLIAVSLLLAGYATDERPVVGSTVKIILKAGHGSGVHIGNGFVLTAGHVGNTDKIVRVKLDDGSDVPGRVLWFSFADDAPDVALIYVEPRLLARVGVSHLSCDKPRLGQTVRIVGNPLDVEFLTTWGRIGRAGPPSAAFPYYVALDATATNGVSGGPVFDDETGDLIGLLVAGYKGTGYTFMTPGSEICRYMGRVA